MDAKLYARLRERFKKVIRGCGLRTHTNGIDSLCDDILTAYSAHGRHFHTVDHLRTCLVAFDMVRKHFECPAEAEFALWFHDYVFRFDVTTDNETLSAIAADRASEKLGMKEWQRSLIISFIMATDHPRNIRRNLSEDAKLIADIDLYGLALSWDTVLKQSRQLRREFIHQDDRTFGNGNILFFTKLLDGRPIYLSRYFQNHGEDLEGRAQKNILNIKQNMMSSIVNARLTDKQV